MLEKTTKLEVEGLVKGAKVTLKREIAEGEDVESHATELLGKLQKMGVTPIEQTASFTPQMVLPEGLTPSPVLNTKLPEMPVLSNPPHTYKIGEAVEELLSPARSIWAGQSRGVKEMQERLMALGIKGVSNIQTFDSYVRKLLKQGRVRREKIDGVYKYYLVSGKDA